MNWITLSKTSELDKIKQDSFHNSQYIFKHSTRCSISKMVLSRFESTNHTESISVYLLDLLSHRDLSNQIADDFNIVHESPQLIIIKKGECHSHSSHTSIHQPNLFE